MTQQTNKPIDQRAIRLAIEKDRLQCKTDSVLFMRKHCKIRHPMKGKIPFDLYPFQEKTLQEFQKHRFNIVLKSRQMGISTLVAAHALHKMLFNGDYNVLVIATTQEVAKNLIAKVQLMFENLSSYMKSNVGIIENNKLTLKFSNGSSIKAVSSSPDSARSEALSLLILDEFAFVDSADQIWTSAQMTLATGGSAIVLSTPNGVGNQFHKLWVKAEEGKAPEEGMEVMNPILLKWDLHPDRDIRWRRQQDELLGIDAASQECDANFLTSGHTVIHNTILDWYFNNLICDPIETRGIGGDYHIWEYPDYNRDYAVVADVARGDGSDYSAFEVFDILANKQVAEFKGKVDTRTFGRNLVSVSTEWNKAILVIDNKNIGWDTVQEVIDMGYPNLYYSFRHDPFLDENIQLRKNVDLKNKEDMVPGFSSNPTLRDLMIQKLETSTREKTLIIKSKRAYNEWTTFKWINGKAQAASGFNDDLTICQCMYLYVKENVLRMRAMGLELNRTAVSKIHKSVYKSNPAASINNGWNQSVGTKNESLKWLL